MLRMYNGWLLRLFLLILLSFLGGSSVYGKSPSYLSPASLKDGLLGKVYDVTLKANGSGTLSWSVTKGKLPPGMELDKNSGRYSGIPTKTGKYAFTVTVSNSVGKGTKVLSHQISALMEPQEAPSSEPLSDEIPDDIGGLDTDPGADLGVGDEPDGSVTADVSGSPPDQSKTSPDKSAPGSDKSAADENVKPPPPGGGCNCASGSSQRTRWFALFSLFLFGISVLRKKTAVEK